MLCGTREDVAAKALAFHRDAGLDLPLLQPVLQEDRQIDELVAAAALYAGEAGRATAGAVAAPTAVPTRDTADEALPVAAAVGLADDRALTTGSRLRRRAGALWEILRPFAYTASVIPVLAGAALAGSTGASNGCPSCWRCSAACCSTPVPTSSTRSTTSGRASTPSPRRAPAMRS